MFFDLDEEQQQLRTILRSFMDAECSTQGLIKRTEQRISNGADMALFERLGGELGLIGAAVPAERGGSDLGLAGLFVIFRELGRAVYGGPFLSSVLAAETLVHADLDGNEDDLMQGLLSGQQSATVVGLGWERNDDLLALDQAGREMLGALDDAKMVGQQLQSIAGTPITDIATQVANNNTTLAHSTGEG